MLSNEQPNVMLHGLTNTKEKTYSCQYCNKRFSHRTSIYKHTHVCQEKQKTSIAILLERIEKLEGRPSSVVYNNTTNNIGNTTNNTINTFGLESVKHIMDDKEFMTRMFMNQPNSYIKLIEKVHFDPEHPENKTVRITNKKEPYVNVHDSKIGWRVEPQDNVLDEMINNTKNMLDEHFCDNEDDLKRKIRDEDVFDRLVGVLRGIKDYMSGEVNVNDKTLQMIKVLKKGAKAMILTYTLMKPT
jgi:hypothetical protein